MATMLIAVIPDHFHSFQRYNHDLACGLVEASTTIFQFPFAKGRCQVNQLLFFSRTCLAQTDW